MTETYLDRMGMPIGRQRWCAKLSSREERGLRLRGRRSIGLIGVGADSLVAPPGGSAEGSRLAQL